MKLMTTTTKSSLAKSDGSAMVYYGDFYLEEGIGVGTNPNHYLWFGDYDDSNPAPRGWRIA